MPETDAPVKPLEPALKPLLLPEIIAKLALGAKIDHRDQDAIVSFEGEAVQLSYEDLTLARKVSERVRQKLPMRITPGSAILSVLLAQQFLAEELFRPGAVRVLFYSNISKASAFYRCMMPSFALGQGSRCVSHVTTGKFTRAVLEYDVVVFQIDHSAGARQFARAAKDAGKKIVYELDDAFDCLEAWHPCYASFGTPERQASIKSMMHLADAVQTSTQWLADRYKKDCSRIDVVPNMIELSSWQTAQKLRKDGIFKIVWAGSSSHSGDLREVVPALSAFLRAHRDAMVVFFGQEMQDTGIPQEQVENIPWCELEDYTFKLAAIDADVSIAPLADIPFNHGKSNLRILQMWATGYPVIASDVGPYKETITHGKDGLLCRSTEDWIRSLEELYKKRGIAKALVAAGTESVKRFDVHPNIQRIEDFYTSLVGER
jgi:glycosyltransferase involved in cell wall biosynthesis